MIKEFCADCVLYGVFCKPEGEKTRVTYSLLRLNGMVRQGTIDSCPIKSAVTYGENRHELLVKAGILKKPKQKN